MSERTTKTSRSPYFSPVNLPPSKKKRKSIFANDESQASDPRFGGLSEQDVMKLTLPDHVKIGLDIMFVGINPGLRSAYVGHHYAGKNNHFWPLMCESGLVPERLTYRDDFKCLDHGIGLTNIVARTTRAASQLSKSEIQAGKDSLVKLLRLNRPLIACFNGKGIYETIYEKKCRLGLQDGFIPGTNTVAFVMPSTSGLVAQYPRKADKLIFFQQLKQLRDELRQKQVGGDALDGDGKS